MGALAKVKDLEIRYPQFLSTKTASIISTDATSVTKMSSTSTQSSSEWLDLNSIMKAAQTLSGEIVLSQLLEKMMLIVIENAGAEKGVLLLPQNDNWFIEAQGQVDSEAVKVLQSIPLENQSIAQTIIHYVERTQENVVLQDASKEGQFTHDPYIVEQRPKSILCLPLLNQGQLTGILYLENHLATGAFTQERLNVLNLLSSQIAISIENARLYTDITQLNQAYKRFVPHEFLSLLEKQSIIEVQLGDQIEKEITIMFSDIRDFTSLSEKMTLQDNFEFINAYLGQMKPIIHECQGIIDKYIGEAIMALFPTSADHALKGAIAMLKALIKYNEILQYTEFETIRIDIWLHTGKLMLGIIGGQARMDGTVISDSVNLASRIEGMTKIYGATLLISEETYSRLYDVSKYVIRTIDRVKVKGKSESIAVYEVFDVDPRFELKMQTRADFENGLVHYRQTEFTEAMTCFKQVLSIHSEDKAAQIYLKRCLHWQNSEISDDWEGIETLDSK